MKAYDDVIAKLDETVFSVTLAVNAYEADTPKLAVGTYDALIPKLAVGTYDAVKA